MSQPKGATKELKIVTRKVVTLDHVKKDPRKLHVLYIINEFSEISEKSLTNLIYLMKSEKGVDLGYEFVMLGETPNSKELLEDIRILLYLGILETDPVTRKLRLTSTGKEFFESVRIDESTATKLKEGIEAFKNKILSEEKTLEMLMRSARGRRRRGRFR